MPSGTPNLSVTVQPAAKPWWRSRTLWANAVVLMLAAAEARLGVLQPLLPLDVYQLVAFVLPLLNLGLRTVTSTALSAGAVAADPVEPPPAERPAP